MNFKRTTYWAILGSLFLFFTFACCSGNEETLFEKDMRIRWNVQQMDMESGRSLIGNNTALQKACTALPDGEGKSIGIWSAYRLKGDSVKNVLGMNGDVNLVFGQSVFWDNREEWIYREEPVSWKYGAVYYFNAYFPKLGGLTSIANDSTSLKGVYDAETIQIDLMVSRVKVDTNNNFQGSPVYLPMKHALATLKFIFLIDEGGYNTNVLKSFSLDNTLKTSASLNYNTETVTVDNWINGASSVNTRIYEWADNSGIPFTATTGAVAYTTGNGIYQTNDGHVFIIPQNCTVAPTFNCTIGEEGFDDVSFENVSLGNTLFEPGKNYIYTIKVKGRVISELKYQVQDWGDGGGNVEFN